MILDGIKSAAMRVSPDCKVEEISTSIAIAWIDAPDGMSHHTLINLKGAENATASELDEYIGRRVRRLLAKMAA